jgi:hypothetical protein
MKNAPEAPLPPGWKAVEDPNTGDKYYWNTVRPLWCDTHLLATRSIHYINF